LLNPLVWRLNEAEMSETHLAYLNLGSNIQPEANLPKALEALSKYGEVQGVSSVWESEAVGTTGPNFLNVCVKFKSTFSQAVLKEQVIQHIEIQLGRERSEDKFAPRTIDIDIMIFDDEFISQEAWKLAYVIVPLAEIYPTYQNPETRETVHEIATRLRREVWLEKRLGVLD
jgi:2-amino-4-hydroxy-6-hydroxymethyldihydropteridine diphosphokinase